MKKSNTVRSGVQKLAGSSFLFRMMGIVILTMVIFSQYNQVLALSSDQQQIYNSGIYYFDTNGSDSSADCSSSTVTEPTVEATGATTWKSGLQSPYYLEEFAINVLGDLAQATNTPQDSTVTKEHVVALIAWFWGEGGDINQDANNGDSPGLFNPLNTSEGADPGSQYADLVDRSYPVKSGGLQSFVSFDAGVEATTLTLLGSFQNRIGTGLTQPNTTADQIMKIITTPQNYPGNKDWADTDQTVYYDHLIKSVSQLRASYDTEASTIIGTTSPEAADGQNVPYGELKYGDSSSSAQSSDSSDSSTVDSSSSSTCSSGINPGSIIQTAVGLAWPSGGHGTSDPTAAYQSALSKYNQSTNDPTDCGGFVATVMRASGADAGPNAYPGVYVPTQYNYVTNSPKYQIIKDVTTTGQLQPGDILMYVNPDDPSDSHTFIYVGQQSGFNGDGAGASLGGHVPEAVNAAGEFSWNGRASSGNYTAARLIQ